ncbi:class I adenylate-forming enzyme family protein [Sulfurovum sp. CS9]|uniref:class I adenylate-forming enzyme family protein n=1 Tax=Sulfurovum sp. CS9 TaxID=3391146 RepID=UPI0039ECC5BC
MSTIKPKVLDDLIRSHAKTDPQKTAICFKDRSISYGVFHDETDRAARMLLGLGIRHGDRVGLMFPNRPDILYLYFACFRIGAIVVPVNIHYQRPEIEYALDHSQCRLLIVDRMFSDITKDIDQTIPSLEHILVYDDPEQHIKALNQYLANAPTTYEWPQIYPDDAAVIFYTSGSTARPKGVIHTHFSLLGNAHVQVATKEIRPETILLVSTGVGYIAGLSGITMPAFLAGCTLVLEPKLQADSLLQAIEHYHIDTTLMLPTMLLEILESPLSETTDISSLRACFVAGDECSHDLYERFKRRTGHDLLQAFGMTECEGYLSNRPSGPKRNRTIGKPSEGMNVRLVDPDGNDVAPGEPGEIIVKGDSVMIGYWEDPENTKKALRDGWLYGDDIASCDEDGFYTFLERKGEIIIHGGENVGPHEVEDIINSYPDVKESCVVGIPDAHYGAILAAYIEWKSNLKHLDIAGLKTWVSTRIAAYKVPDRWSVLEQLPKTPTGKLDRKALHLKAEAEAKLDNNDRHQ